MPNLTLFSPTDTIATDTETQAAGGCWCLGFRVGWYIESSVLTGASCSIG